MYIPTVCISEISYKLFGYQQGMHASWCTCYNKIEKPTTVYEIIIGFCVLYYCIMNIYVAYKLI